MEKNYKILNCTKDSSIEEITDNYLKLKKQYSEQRFLEGEEGNVAAKKLTELEIAYKEVLDDKQTQKENTSDKIEKIRRYISKNDLTNAQYVLDTFDERDDKWHYYQSVVFYKKSWYNESKKQLEIAMSMAPENEKYHQEYKKLTDFLSNSTSQTIYKNNTDQTTFNDSAPQMGGSGCMQSCCECLVCNALLNCCCSCGR